LPLNQVLSSLSTDQAKEVINFLQLSLVFRLKYFPLLLQHLSRQFCRCQKFPFNGKIFLAELNQKFLLYLSIKVPSCLLSTFDAGRGNTLSPFWTLDHFKYRGFLGKRFNTPTPSCSSAVFPQYFC